MELPKFWKSTLVDIDECLARVRKGCVETIATSPSGRSVHLVSYGRANDLDSQANYNSACGARNPAWYAHKPAGTPPSVFIVGPVHGQEVENIVGLVNLINLAETGNDLLGRPWPELSTNLAKCRVLIIPCGNPDGRERCPYDSWVGLECKTMTHYGQGSRADGRDYGWPGCKARHPMVGDVGFLGAYYNDDGININHDDFFDPMAAETKAIFDVARREAPDCVVMLHSCANGPFPIIPPYVSHEIKWKVKRFADRLADRYAAQALPHMRISPPTEDGAKFPPPAMDLSSAVHHVCGAMSCNFECIHGFRDGTCATHEQILDVQLILFDELLKFALSEPAVWER